jgi:hypothetical protein
MEKFDMSKKTIYCSGCSTQLLAAYCAKCQPDRFIRAYRWLSSALLRLRFAFANHYTVDTDSPTWKEELDNIAEIEESRNE